MPSWGEVLKELEGSRPSHGGNPDFDGVRRKYLKALHDLTGRDVILYSTNWLGGPMPGSAITLEDMQGMMEVCRGLKGPALDVILHSPGGSAEATASIVRYLRRKFTDVRVFVPLAAMSAATMWALSANEIMMGKHSQLGPIDPQLVTAQGQTPARAIIEQFDKAKKECAANPAVLGAWLPILQQYGPALLEQCEKAEQLAKRLVQQWLAQYMFNGHADAAVKAKRVADFFADYTNHQSHSLGIDRDEARSNGVNVVDLESNQALQDAVLSIHHATIHTFSGSPVKIIENHLGRAFVTHVAQAMVGPTITIPMRGPSPNPPGVT